MSIVERALSRAKAQSGASATPSLSGRAADTDAIPRLEDPALVPTLTVDPASEQLVLDVVPINRDALRQAGLLPVETAERQIASQYRHIKDRALRPERDEADVTPAPVRILVVSSALSGDGKTFTALNLALRIAREGSNGVLLVDADIAKHHLTSVLDLADRPGLADLVSSRRPVALSDAVAQSDVSGLRLLGVGRVTESTVDDLCGPRMPIVLASLRDMSPNQVVLIDAGPLLLAPEAPSFAKHSDSLLIVVRAGATPKAALQEALQRVSGDRLIQMVLNCAAPMRHGHGTYGNYQAYQ